MESEQLCLHGGLLHLTACKKNEKERFLSNQLSLFEALDAGGSVIGTLESDSLAGSDVSDTIYGGGAENASGDAADTIRGAGGNDLLLGNGGSDLLYGDAGSDELLGGVGNDTLFGGADYSDSSDGGDTLDGQAGTDILYGNGGDDTLTGGNGRDTVYGGFGDDNITGGNSYESLGDGGDFIVAGPGADVVSGNEGDDTIYGGYAINAPDDEADTIDGGSGNDLIYGNGGADNITGGSGDDTIYGGLGDDTITGGAGNDTYYADAGDEIIGGEGVDTYILNASDLTAQQNIQAFSLDGSSGNAVIQLFNVQSGDQIRIVNHLGEVISVETVGAGSAEIKVGNEVLARIEGNNLETLLDDGLNDEGEFVLHVNRDITKEPSAAASPPEITDLISTTTFAESVVNSGAQLLDSDITLTDLDSQHFANGSLTLSYSTAVDNADQLSVLNTGVGTGEIWFDGTNIRYEGVEFATINGGDGMNGNDLILNFDENATLEAVEALIENLTYAHTGDAPNASRVVTLTLNDGRATTEPYEITVNVTAENDAPTTTGIADQTTNEDSFLNFAIPDGSFADPDGDTLTYSATLTDSSPLPGWLSLNGTTGEFFGTPTNDDLGVINIRVTATDTAAVDVTTDFALTINNVNDTPTLDNALIDQAATEDSAFNYQFSANSFGDVDAGDSLTYSVTSSLPSWLGFTAGTRTLAGTPVNADVGDVDVTIRATDSAGAFVEDTVRITVANVNDAPTHTLPGAQTLNEDSSFTFNTANSSLITVADVDNDSLTDYTLSVTQGTLTLSQTTGLTFDAGDGTADATISFSGTIANINAALDGLLYTPTVSYNGADTLTVSTDDGAGAVVDTVALTVNNVNDAPVLDNALIDQAASEDVAFSYSFAANSFSDPFPVADTITYTATLSDNSALPSWLSFDGATRTFSGTALGSDTGAISVRVTATDSFSANVSDDFDITISSNNDAPTFSAATPVTLTAVDEETASPAGDTVSNLIAARYQDEDSDSFAGIAITANAATAGEGIWEANTGSGWSSIGTAINSSTALILEPSAQLRFVPAADFNGTPGDLTMHLWDGTGTAFANGSTQDISTLINDTMDPFSNSTIALNTSITAVNDNPTLETALLDQFGSVTSGVSYDLSASFADVDTVTGQPLQTLSYSLEVWDGSAWSSTLPAGLSVDGAGVVTYAAAATSGVFNVRGTATDDDGTPLSVSDEFILAVAPDAYYGTNNIDTITGSNGDDVMILLDSNDTAYGDSGNDTIFGGEGADDLYGDTTTGGTAGNDLLYGGTGSDDLYGDASDHVTGGADTLYGGDGGDRIYGYAGNDSLYGEDGADYIEGGDGADTIDGGTDSDNIYGGAGDDLIDGGAGDDDIYSEDGTDTLTGGAGNDRFFILQESHSSTAEADIITDFTQGEDSLFTPGYLSVSAGNAAASTADALTFEYDAGNTRTLVYGNAGALTLILEANTTNPTGNFTLTATDFIFATGFGDAGDNSITGTGSIDLIFGFDGNDTIDSGGGNDTIYGGDGDDSIEGGDNDDYLVGGAGNDFIDSGHNNDTIEGGAGNDTLDGGVTSSTITGGTGNDVFLMNYQEVSSRRLIDGDYNGHLIKDFTQGEDKIDVSALAVKSYVTSGHNNVNLTSSYNAGNDTTDIRFYGGQDYYQRTFIFRLEGNITLNNSDFIFNNAIIEDTTGNETLNGSGIDDIFITSFAGNTVNGGAGNDIIHAMNDNNTIYTGDDYDFVWLRGSGDTIFGGDDTDIVYDYTSGGSTSYAFLGDGSDDTRYFYGHIFMEEGDDGTYFQANADNTTIYGGDGNDSFSHVSSGAITLYGERGNDSLGIFTSWYNSAATGSIAYGGEGNDTLTNRENVATTLHGGYGADTIRLQTLSSNVTQTVLYYDPNESTDSETDTFENNNSDRFFDAGAEATADNVVIYGFTGIAAGAASGTTLGYSYDGTNTIVTSSADYSFELKFVGDYTGGGAETFDLANNFEFRTGTLGTMSADTMISTISNEFMFGLEGNDTITGGTGNDSIFGGHDSDIISGNSGNDSLSGGYADDSLNGNAGVDTLEGGSGNDIFIFNNLTDSTDTNTDVIIDFKHGDDTDQIDLTGLGITGIGSGASEITIQYHGDQYTAISHNSSSFEIFLQGYYELGVDISASDFIF